MKKQLNRLLIQKRFVSKKHEIIECLIKTKFKFTIVLIDNPVLFLFLSVFGHILTIIGWNRTLNCKTCRVRWNGSHLILGSMYSYDIFAAVPCCPERLRCNNCQHLVVPPERRMEYFSDYSHSMPCSHCGIVDHHFIKPLAQTYVQNVLRLV